MSGSPSQRKKSRDKVRSHRERLRAQGLRPVKVWIPDTRTAKFAREARRQSLLIANGGDEDDQAFVDAISEFNEA